MAARRFLIAFGLLLGPGALSGQVVRGRVLDAVQGTAIAGALVELQDSTGRLMQRDLTTPTGGFRFVAPTAGRYRVRAAAIGFAVRPAAVVDLSESDVLLHEFHLSPAVAILADLVVAASNRRTCGLAILDDPVFGRLFAGAQTSLAVMEAGFANRRTPYPVELVRSTVVRSGNKTISKADTTHEGFNKWPLESIDPALLEIGGFASVLPVEEGGGRIYYGPDLRVLFAEWFLESHCYTFSQQKGDASSGVVRVAFEPKGKSKLVDIAGELVLDATTTALRQLNYEHRNLPSPIKNGMAGGTLDFAPLPSGVWMPTEWRIFGPIESRSVPRLSSTRVRVIPGARGSLPGGVSGLPVLGVAGRVELHGTVLGSGSAP